MSYQELISLSPKFKKHLPKHIYNMFLGKAVIPTVLHLRLCTCQQHLLEEYKVKALERARLLYDSRGLGEHDVDGKIWLGYEHKAVNEQYLELLASDLREQGVRCPIEEQVIKDFLTVYASKYDLGDANIFNLVEPLMNFKLTVDRYSLFSQHHDFVTTKKDKYNNQSLVISPVEELRLKYDMARASTVEKLNNMVEGVKSKNLNINMTVDAVPLKDILGD
jgi:hypothetical protein